MIRYPAVVMMMASTLLMWCWWWWSVVVVVTGGADQADESGNKVTVCYYASWANYRPGTTTNSQLYINLCKQ